MGIAASCLKVTSCQAFDQSSLVVQGTVTDMTDVDLGTETIGGRPYQRIETLVTIDVEKAWKGATPGTTVQVHTDGRRSSNGIEFVRGQRYVVFAYEREGRFKTSICTHTNPLDKAGEDLAFLETLSRPAAGGRVYGRVALHQRVLTLDAKTTPRAMGGRRVSLNGPSGVREAVTTEDGRYQFEGLAPGAYELDADLPVGWSREGLPRALTLPSVRSCEEVIIWTAIDGRLSGQVVGTDGRPLPRVQVDALLLESPRRSDVETTLPVSGVTDGQGRFELDRLSPGRCIVGVQVKRAANNQWPYQFTAYPGTTQTEPATPITLDPAQRLDLRVLTVARVQAARTVQGRVSFADGRPVMSARIVVSEIRPDWAGPEVRPTAPIRIDTEGRFTVELYRGRALSHGGRRAADPAASSARDARRNRRGADGTHVCRRPGPWRLQLRRGPTHPLQRGRLHGERRAFDRHARPR